MQATVTTAIQSPQNQEIVTFQQRLTQIWDEEMARTLAAGIMTKSEFLFTVDRIGLRVRQEIGECEAAAFWEGIEAWANMHLRGIKSEGCRD